MGFRFVLALLCAWFWPAQVVLAQGNVQPRRLVDAPTAGLLPRGSFGLDFQFYESSGILAQLDVGVFSRGQVGFAFGGQNIVGNQDVRWNPRVEFAGRVRVIEETGQTPGVAVGFQSQGNGAYDESLDRYTSKSKGFYVVASRNFASAFGEMGVHGGFNRSLEDGDGDGDWSGFVGIDKQFGPAILVLVEYDFGLNDNEDNTLGSGKGFLNTGVRWAVSPYLALEVDLKNLFQNGHRNPNPDRELRILYYESF